MRKRTKEERKRKTEEIREQLRKDEAKRIYEGYINEEEQPKDNPNRITLILFTLLVGITIALFSGTHNDNTFITIIIATMIGSYLGYILGKGKYEKKN